MSIDGLIMQKDSKNTRTNCFDCEHSIYDAIDGCYVCHPMVHGQYDNYTDYKVTKEFIPSWCIVEKSKKMK